jgi:plasmid maintenance system antidote protein VapI
VRFGGDALTEGVEIHRIEGETVRVYSRRGVSADTAMRLARYFGGDARSWPENFQQRNADRA